MTRVFKRLRAVRTGLAEDDRGLTLIELLVVIAILSIIVVPLGDALVNYFQHENDTTDRLSVSRDSQIAAAFFAQDVASTGRRNWDPTTEFPLTQSVYTNSGGPAACGTGDRPVVRFLRDDPIAAQGAPVLAVAYWTRTVNGQLQLHRVACDANGNVTSDLAVAYNLDPDPAKFPTPTCAPVACTDPSVPQTVSLTLSLKSPNANSSDSLIVTLYGQRRPTS